MKHLLILCLIGFCLYLASDAVNDVEHKSDPLSVGKVGGPALAAGPETGVEQGPDSFEGVKVGGPAPTAGSEWTSDRGELLKVGEAFGLPNALIGVRTCGKATVHSIGIVWAWGDHRVSNPLLETIRQQNEFGAAQATANDLISALKKQGWSYVHGGQKDSFGATQGFGSFKKGALQRQLTVTADPVKGGAVILNLGPDTPCR